MYLFYFLAAFLFIRRLKLLIKDTGIFPQWNSLLTIAMWSVAGFYFVTENLFNYFINGILGCGILAGTLYYIYNEPAFKALKSYVRAHYPLVVAGFIDTIVRSIAPQFHRTWNNFFHLVIVGAFVWIFARWANSKKQQEELKMVNNRKQELEVLVAERTEALIKQKDELQEALKELKATQTQLIQQEKLASLGELTAGIAHEIQNPLNFVNNFSDVSRELIDEMQLELDRGDKEEAMAIATDLKQNLEKISHHGKRADAIVKGMLEHSRTSTGTKEPTEINELADEYLRLSYHGLRAKDKSFNADFKMFFDDSIGKINVVPQDMGRVLLNLFNNAFFAVNEKKARLNGSFQPVVSVTTQKTGDEITIVVKDNGNGVPQKVMDKIFQPFFTTKPTGQGTGLGLSLSYDIIKSHGGELNVESKEGEGAAFIIRLPLENNSE